MCIMPGQPQVLIPPTGKASIIAHYLRFVVLVHFLLAILAFTTFQIIPGVFDLLGSFIGLLALRRKEGYVFQQVLCYTLYCGARFLTSILTLALAYSQSDLGLDQRATWQFYSCIALWCMQPFVFASGAALGWLLHTELRKVVAEMTAAMGGGGGDGSQAGGGGLFGFGGGGGGGGAGGAGSGAAREASSESSGSYQAPLLRGSGGAASSSAAAAAAAEQSGFRAFAGQGHRLGGT